MPAEPIDLFARHDPILTMQPPRCPHDDVVLAGNRQGLMQLRALLSLVLDNIPGDTKEYMKAEFLAPDGECYDLLISLFDAPFTDPHWRSVPVIYVDDLTQSDLDRLPWKKDG